MATHYEGFGLVLCEAMAAKTPVISTDVSGANEVVLNNKTGLLVEDNNILDLANNILKMKNSKELRESLSKEAYEFINEKFSLELMYKNYENSIKEMIYNE